MHPRVDSPTRHTDSSPRLSQRLSQRLSPRSAAVGDGADGSDGSLAEKTRDAGLSQGPRVPKLHLGSIPPVVAGGALGGGTPVGGTPGSSAARGGAAAKALLVGSILRGVPAALPTANQEHPGQDPVAQWAAGGGPVSWGDALDDDPAARPALGSLRRLDRSVASALLLLLGNRAGDLAADHTRAVAASSAAASVFLCTARGRQCFAPAPLPTNDDDELSALEAALAVLRQGGEGLDTLRRDSVRLLLAADARDHGWIATQLVNRCDAVAAVEAKVVAVQQQRERLGASAAERRRWVQHLCCCAAERMAYALKLRGLVEGAVAGASSGLTASEAGRWARASARLLAPLPPLVRSPTTANPGGASALSYLHSGTLHGLTGALGRLAAVQPGAVLAALQQSEAATAALASHLDWLLSVHLSGDVVAAPPLRPLPRPARAAMVGLGLKALRRIAQAAALAAAAPASCSCAAGRAVLGVLHSEDAGVALRLWLERLPERLAQDQAFSGGALSGWLLRSGQSRTASGFSSRSTPRERGLGWGQPHSSGPPSPRSSSLRLHPAMFQRAPWGVAPGGAAPLKRLTATALRTLGGVAAASAFSCWAWRRPRVELVR